VLAVSAKMLQTEELRVTKMLTDLNNFNDFYTLNRHYISFSLTLKITTTIIITTTTTTTTTAAAAAATTTAATTTTTNNNNNNNNNTGILTKSLMKNRKTYSRFTTKDSCTWNVTYDA
jgi:hypothetical protein